MMAMLWAQQIMLGRKLMQRYQGTSESKIKRNLGRFRNGELARKNDETADKVNNGH